MSIEAEIERYLLSEQSLENDGQKIDPDESLISSGILDSMSLLRLINFIEEQFSITIDDNELTADNFQTIKCIKLLIEKKRQALTKTT